MYVGDSVVIISRHPAAVEFLRMKLRDFDHAIPVLGEAEPLDVADKHVYGNVPLVLGACAASISAIEFKGEPPRGREYTLDDMVESGAHIVRYSVRREAETEQAGVML